MCLSSEDNSTSEYASVENEKSEFTWQEKIESSEIFPLVSNVSNIHRVMLSMLEALKSGVPHLSLSLSSIFVLLSYWSPRWTGQDLS